MAAETYAFARRTADGTSIPCASDAAIALANVHPVPCVLCVVIRGAVNERIKSFRTS